MAAPVAQVEGWSHNDGDVLLSPTTTIAAVTGLAHAGGADQAAANALLWGYWLICVWDRDADGVLAATDRPWSYEAYYYGRSGSPLGASGISAPAVDAIGWDGTEGNLLGFGDVFHVVAGRMYIILAVAVNTSDERTADVLWVPGDTTPDLDELLGLTADGLLDASVGDYEAVGCRVNRCDPPRLL